MPKNWDILRWNIEQELHELDMAGEIYTGHYNYLCDLLDRFYAEERSDELYAEMKEAA